MWKMTVSPFTICQGDMRSSEFLFPYFLVSRGLPLLPHLALQVQRLNVHVPPIDISVSMNEDVQASPAIGVLGTLRAMSFFLV